MDSLMYSYEYVVVYLIISFEPVHSLCSLVAEDDQKKTSLQQRVQSAKTKTTSTQHIIQGASGKLQ